MTETIDGTRDNTGRPGDRNKDYTFGSARSGLTWHEQAKLLPMRGLVMDANSGDFTNRVAGDVAWVELAASGLYVPIEPLPGQQSAEDVPRD